MKFYCVKCEKEIIARLTDGEEIYSHRPDLYDLPFWVCDGCKNYIGCHHKTKNRTQPLGRNIPTKELRNARQQIHKILDPIWKSKKMKRKKLYNLIAEKMGRKKYHTGDMYSMNEARKVYQVVAEINNSLI